MGKPRVIVADPDEHYVIPIQSRFAAMFGDRIHLEIITDPEYFAALFDAPQHADVVLVSEQFYSSQLKRHDIRRLILLTEKEDAGKTTELDVQSIYKYTSVQEIFQWILGSCSDLLYAEQGDEKKAKIVLLTSAQGGVGKTSVALGLCKCLEKNFKRTLYINADHLQTFQWFLEDPEPIRGPAVYGRLSYPSQNLYREIAHVIRKEDFSYLPPFQAALFSLSLSYQVYGAVAEGARSSGEYDYIVIDADSAFDVEKTQLLDLADKVILLTKQSRQNMQALDRYLMNLNRNTGGKYDLVCNDFQEGEENAFQLPMAGGRVRVSEYIEHISSPERLNKGIPLDTPGLQKLMFLIL